MKISTETNSARKLVGSEKAIELIAKAGFDAFDFSMFEMASYNWSTGELTIGDSPLNGDGYLKYIRSLKQIADDNGIICNQTHAPFPTQATGIEKYIKRAIECSAELGAKYCIVHPLSLSPIEENIAYYNELLPFAKDCGVIIATENMFGWDSSKNRAQPAACSPHTEFASLLDAVNDDYLTACLDIGHAELDGVGTSAVEMINALGSKLRALHIHDNNLKSDLHKLPFTDSIDFDKVIRALKHKGYSGYLTLEADAHLRSYSAENVFEGIKIMAQAARKLSDMFETL